jgi:glycosyltransferase involved in cell wall biosynthesis
MIYTDAYLEMRSRNEKILFFSHCHTGAGMDGANRILLTSAKGIDGYEKYFLSPGKGVISNDLAAAGIKEIVMDYDCPGFNSHIFHYKNKDDFDGLCARMERSLRNTELFRFFQQLKPDIVYVNTAIAVQGAILAKMVGAKVLWHIHEIISNYLSDKDQQNLSQVIDRYSDKIIAVSRASVAALGATGIKDKCELIYNGVENPRYSKEDIAEKRHAIRRRMGLDDNAPVFAFLGQIIWAKGVTEYIHAAHLALKRMPSARFLIIGNPGIDPQYTRKLRNLVRKYDRKREIRFTGYSSDLTTILPAIDCLVVPSVYEDPMPTVMMEASLFRKPLVAFNRGGIGEFVINGRNGFLVERDNISKLAAAMCTMGANRSAAMMMGRYGYKRAVNKYGLERYLENINEIIKEVENSRYQSNPLRCGKVVRGSGHEVYYMDRNQKKHIVDEKALFNNGLDWSDITAVEEELLQAIPEGDPIT